jgi:hypothetical protein
LRRTKIAAEARLLAGSKQLSMTVCAEQQVRAVIAPVSQIASFALPLGTALVHYTLRCLPPLCRRRVSISLPPSARAPLIACPQPGVRSFARYSTPSPRHHSTMHNSFTFNQRQSSIEHVQPLNLLQNFTRLVLLAFAHC